jgi:hypothetical protein
MRFLFLVVLFATGCNLSVDKSLTTGQKIEFLKSKGYRVITRKDDEFTVYQNGFTVTVKVTNDLKIVFPPDFFK